MSTINESCGLINAENYVRVNFFYTHRRSSSENFQVQIAEIEFGASLRATIKIQNGRPTVTYWSFIKVWDNHIHLQFQLFGKLLVHTVIWFITSISMFVANNSRVITIVLQVLSTSTDFSFKFTIGKNHCPRFYRRFVDVFSKRVMSKGW